MKKLKQWQTYNDKAHEDIMAPIKDFNFLEFCEEDINKFMERVVVRYKNNKNKFMLEDVRTFILYHEPYFYIDVNIDQKGEKSKNVKMLLNAFECHVNGKTNQVLTKIWREFMTEQFGESYTNALADRLAQTDTVGSQV